MSKTWLLLFSSLIIIQISFAQKTDSAKNPGYISGSSGVTNNGISLIPSFSLDKPAAIFDFSVGKSKFSFDNEFTFSLKGKPWYFLFWPKYKWAITPKLRVDIGAQYSLTFRNIMIPSNSDSSEVSVADRYIVGTLVPNFFITPNISIGVFYLYAHGLDPSTVNSMNFVTVNANFSNIKLGNKIFLGFAPQFYYLSQDQKAGYYFTSALSVNKKDFPLSLSAVINKVIDTKIPSKDFVWNVTLIYFFGRHNFAL
jgi:hypothetical protein